MPFLCRHMQMKQKNWLHTLSHNFAFSVLCWQTGCEFSNDSIVFTIDLIGFWETETGRIVLRKLHIYRERQGERKAARVSTHTCTHKHTHIYTQRERERERKKELERESDDRMRCVHERKDIISVPHRYRYRAVCVCERETERERDERNERTGHWTYACTNEMEYFAFSFPHTRKEREESLHLYDYK